MDLEHQTKFNNALIEINKLRTLQQLFINSYNLECNELERFCIRHLVNTFVNKFL